MGNITSVHIKPCKVGTSRAHNMRTAEYMANLTSDKIYIRTDLTSCNESWLDDAVSTKTLQQYFDELVQLYTEKVKQKPQLKPRERKNPKTGKVTVIEGWSPLREDTVIISADTTMKQLHDYARQCKERFGIRAVEIHIHKDEGHCTTPGDLSSFKHNYHAHVAWDWVNHETGKTYKLNAEDMSAMQDIAAECLSMSRGRTKSETGAVHLERNDYIVAKQKKESEKAVRIKKEAEKIRDKAEDDSRRAKNQQNQAEMLRDIALAGNEKLNKDIQSKRSEAKAIDLAISEKHKESARLDIVIGNKKTEVAKSGESLLVGDLKSRLKWRESAIRSLGKFLYHAWDIFKKAIDTIVSFAKSSFNIFDGAEAKTIRNTIDSLASKETDRCAISTFLMVTADHFGAMTDQ